ncbi:hypothetical protein C2W62_35850 [Candidatus Entotheonella serta]|nr:hypothetical protein C2W62_35850 [Candidatus Entotheonella serta]
MAEYRTPGVYVDEVATFPPSVVPVSTAVPAFIGYTKTGSEGAVTVKRINTLLEYETEFGGAPPCAFRVMQQENSSGDSYTLKVEQTRPSSAEGTFLLYYSLALYFNNGGGSCYVVSVGNYNNQPNADDFKQGLEALKQEDEPTLIVLTDATPLGATAYYDLCQQALNQCEDMRDLLPLLMSWNRIIKTSQTFTRGSAMQTSCMAPLIIPT